MVARLPGALSFCVAAQRMLGQAGGWWAMNRGCLWGWWQSPCEERSGHTLGPLLQAVFQIHGSCSLLVTQHLAQVSDLAML